jgi:GntR family transcriptional repressor for pyruvate dehydrogenase complex
MQRTLLKFATDAEPRLSRCDVVYSTIVERILNKNYRMGDRLPTEAELARQFDVSRVTIRTALGKLRNRRLVVSVQGSGNYICGLPLGESDRLLDAVDHHSNAGLFEFRVGLETQGAALAARRHNAEDVAYLCNLTRTHPEYAGPTSEWLIDLWAWDLDFHQGVARASGNPIVHGIMNSVAPLLSMPWLTWDADEDDDPVGITNQVLREHRTIADAIAAGDSDMARVAMQFHLTHARGRTIEQQADLA